LPTAKRDILERHPIAEALAQALDRQHRPILRAVEGRSRARRFSATRSWTVAQRLGLLVGVRSGDPHRP
jgi:hypothetical protein